MSKRTILLLLAVPVSVALILSGCTKDMVSAYDPHYSTAPAPKVTSVTPASGPAAIQVMTVTGTSFSPTPGNNIVYFDATPGTVLSASSTQLTVLTGLVVKDSVKLRVAVYKVDSLSNIAYVNLTSPTNSFAALNTKTSGIYGCATDASGNVYTSFANDSLYKFTPAGVKTKYFYNAALQQFQSLKIGPGSLLYGTNSTARAYRLTPPGTAAQYIRLAAGTIKDIDFDQSGNMWACGGPSSFYRIVPPTIKTFPLSGTLRSIRVVVSSGQEYIYLAGFVLPDSAEMVVRYPYYAAGDSLGPRETVFNYSTSPVYVSGATINAITFASTGEMFVGTSGTPTTTTVTKDPLIMIPPGGSPTVFAPGALTGPITALAWGQGPTLFMTFMATDGAKSALQAINTLLPGGAPYYGQGL